MPTGSELYARNHFDRKYIVFCEIVIRKNNSQIASWILIYQQCLLLKTIETHFRYVLLFSAFGETQAYVTGYLIWWKIQCKVFRVNL